MMKAYTWDSGRLVTSHQHILLVPDDVAKDAKATCKYCEATGEKYSHSNCFSCSGIHSPGYKSFVAQDCSLASPGYMNVCWHHIVLEDVPLDTPIVLGNGWLTEGLRHRFMSRRKDRRFELVE